MNYFINSKAKNFIQHTLLCLLTVFLLFPTTTTLSAASVTEIPAVVANTSESVIQLILSCTDANGNTYYIHHGTGFVAGTSEETQYILTSSDTITATAEQLNQIRKWAGLSNEDTLTTQVSVLLNSDILISANVISTGSSLPYALLTPEQPLNNISSVKFNFCENITRGQSAFSYGYNADQSLLGQISLPSITPSYKNGTVTNISLEPLLISTDITAESGFAGAPVLDANGYVIGMFYSTNGNMEILPSDTILSVLDALSVTHQTNTPNSDYNIADDTIKQELATLLAECQQDVMQSGSRYSEKTLDSYKEAITNAMEVTANSSSTKDDYQSCINALNEAREALKPYNYTYRIVQLILAVVLLLLLVINMRQYFKSVSLYQTLHPEHAVKKAAKKTAALIRVDTNEVIWITTKELRIGSDSNMVDYTINDNPAISHYHAAIIQKDHQYYIIDNHSTNHTSVNHTMLLAAQPYLLNDNDTILLANETFIFHFLEA